MPAPRLSPPPPCLAPLGLRLLPVGSARARAVIRERGHGKGPQLQHATAWQPQYVLAARGAGSGHSRAAQADGVVLVEVRAHGLHVQAPVHTQALAHRPTGCTGKWRPARSMHYAPRNAPRAPGGPGPGPAGRPGPHAQPHGLPHDEQRPGHAAAHAAGMQPCTAVPVPALQTMQRHFTASGRRDRAISRRYTAEAHVCLQALDTAAAKLGNEPLVKVQLSQLRGGGSVVGITASHIVAGPWGGLVCHVAGAPALYRQACISLAFLHS